MKLKLKQFFRLWNPLVLREQHERLNQVSELHIRVLLIGGAGICLACLLLQLFIGTLPDYGHCVELGIGFLVSLAILLGYHKIIAAHASLSLYVWIGLILLFAAFLGSFFDQQVHSFLFPMLLAVLPLLVVDAPYKTAIFSLAMFLADAGMVIISKEPEFIREDLAIAFTCMLISDALSVLLVNERCAVWAQGQSFHQESVHDALTGILNRGGGQQLADEMITSGMGGTFLLMDVDNFKHVNDTYGHEAGDHVLHDVGQALQNHFRPGDVVMRMGGDEFIVYAPGLADRRSVEAKLEELRQAFHQIYMDSQRNEHITCSIGCVINLGSYPSYEALYATADKMLYITKQKGKDGSTLTDADYAA